jgi:hypothetical protein
MFPISDDKLSFSRIANFWSREIKPPASAFELLNLLESAWWRGEIIGEAAVSRLQLIQHLFKSTHDFGVVVVVGDQPGLPETKELPDGTVEVDLRPRVNVPSTDTDAWNDTNCAPAYQILAATSSLASDPAIAPVLCAIKLSRHEFTQWLVRSGYYLPTFWRIETNNDAPGSAQRPGNRLVGSAGRRGPRPNKRQQVKDAMWGDLQQNRCSVADLQKALEKTLAETYGVSRDTARKARTEVVLEFKSQQIATNDK